MNATVVRICDETKPAREPRFGPNSEAHRDLQLQYSLIKRGKH